MKTVDTDGYDAFDSSRLGILPAIYETDSAALVQQAAAEAATAAAQSV